MSISPDQAAFEDIIRNEYAADPNMVDAVVGSLAALKEGFTHDMRSTDWRLCTANHTFFELGYRGPDQDRIRQSFKIYGELPPVSGELSPVVSYTRIELEPDQINGILKQKTYRLNPDSQSGAYFTKTMPVEMVGIGDNTPNQSSWMSTEASQGFLAEADLLDLNDVIESIQATMRPRRAPVHRLLNKLFFRS